MTVAGINHPQQRMSGAVFSGLYLISQDAKSLRDVERGVVLGEWNDVEFRHATFLTASHGAFATRKAVAMAGSTLLPHMRTCAEIENFRPSWPRSMM